jgi:hypothetical protein
MADDVRAVIRAADPTLAARCQIHLCAPDGPTDAGRRTEGPDPSLLEVLSGHLATLLGVTPLHLAHGWADRSLSFSSGASAP